LVSQTKGEIEAQGKVLVVRRIHVEYQLKITPEKRLEAERAHQMHVDFCPVARTIRDCVEITTSLVMENL
jgi:organic hydroperoxide reductase OsmC/OhrA